MISINRFDYSIDILQPCRFIADKENNTRRTLEEHLLGTCYQGSIISEIVEIEKMSLCRTINTDHRCHSSMNVIFTAKTITYPPGTVIADTAAFIKDDHACARSEHVIASLSFEMRGTKRMMRPDMRMPLLVMDGPQEYETGSKQVTVCGTIFTCRRSPTFYQTSGSLSSADTRSLRKLVEEIKRIDISGDSFSFLRDMLYSYTKEARGPGISSLEVVAGATGEDLTGYWYKDLALHMEDLNINRSRDKPKGAEIIIEMKPFQMVSSLLLSVLHWKMAIRDMAEVYADRDRYEYLWSIMRAHKIAN